MSEGQIEHHVTIRRADTHEPLTHVLLPMEPELWDPSGRRATVLLDPARIKRGLAPHREVGYPLEVGVPIEVVVDDGFLDADRRELAGEYVRRYDVAADARVARGARDMANGRPGDGHEGSIGRVVRRPAGSRVARALPRRDRPGRQVRRRAIECRTPTNGRGASGPTSRGRWVRTGWRSTRCSRTSPATRSPVSSIERSLAADHDGLDVDRVYVDLPAVGARSAAEVQNRRPASGPSGRSSGSRRWRNARSTAAQTVFEKG